MKLSSSELTKIFQPAIDHPNRIFGREGKTIEYKESYNHAGMPQYFKTMASFANAEGGYIIFGIGDSPRIYKGLSEKSKRQFDELKIEEFTNNLNEYFQPEINWEHTLFEYKSKDFGIIYTYKLDNKPCICKKNYDQNGERYSLREGDIYYRYRAQTEKIKYSELNQIFIDKEREYMKLWVDLFQKIAKIGVENASLLDLKTGNFDIGDAKLLIDESMLNKLHFIKEGNFNEKEGAPTLRVIGDVEGITPAKIMRIPTPKLRAIEQEDIIDAFLTNRKVEAPTEYIKAAINCNSGFQPIYYFMKSASLKQNQLINILNDYRESTTTKIIRQRLEGRRVDFKELKNTGTEAYFGKKKFLKNWVERDVNKINFDELQKREINWFLEAFFSIEDNILFEYRDEYKELLDEIYNVYFRTSKSEHVGKFRKIICRLDEVIYFNNLIS